MKKEYIEYEAINDGIVDELVKVGLDYWEALDYSDIVWREVFDEAEKKFGIKIDREGGDTLIEISGEKVNEAKQWIESEVWKRFLLDLEAWKKFLIDLKQFQDSIKAFRQWLKEKK